MDQQSKQLEQIFKTACEQQTVTPSSRVLRKLKTRLWVSDFFSINPRKVNIVYATLLLGGITSTALLMRTSEKKLSNLNDNRFVIVEEKKNNLKSISAVPEAKLTEEQMVNEAKGSVGLLRAEFSMNSSRGCAPLSVNFANQSVAGSEYSWDFGTGEQSIEKSPVYTYNKPGNYHVILTVKNNEGQLKTYAKEVQVLERPVAGFEIDINNSEIKDKKLVINNNSVGGTSYTWDFGDNQKATGSKVTHTYTDFGIYTVRLISLASNGCSDTAVLTNTFFDKNYELSFPLNFRPNPVERNNGYYEKAGSETAIFYPKNFGAENYQLAIYAPNGLKVFSTNTIKQGWNGYIGMHLAPAGDYLWDAKGIYPNGKPFNLKGTVIVKAQEYD